MRINILLWVFLAIVLSSGCRDAKRYHDENPPVLQKSNGDVLGEIAEFQKELNASLLDPELSPLSDSERQIFEGLEFFKADTLYRVYATLDITPDATPFLMPTTTTRKSMERVFGIARFSIGDKNFELEVYQNLDLLDEEGYENYLFLPFTDKTNGEDTYSGGRYIDLEIPEGRTLLIDFNKAYNPYCVYNEKYSCPIVPAVNHLDTEILAGIKDYRKKEP